MIIKQPMLHNEERITPGSGDIIQNTQQSQPVTTSIHNTSMLNEEEAEIPQLQMLLQQQQQ